MIRKKEVINKQQIISEYLTGECSYSSLSKKHGVKCRTIQTWVRCYRIRNPNLNLSLDKGEDNIKAIKKQLEHVLLKNEILEEMLNLAQEHSGIDFRKKFGAKQS